MDHSFLNRYRFGLSKLTTEKISEKDESEKFRLSPFFIKNEMLQCTTVSNLNVALSRAGRRFQSILRKERMLISMHIGSKGWYVEELKKAGVRRYEERKVESYKKHVLANLLERTR